MAHIQKFKVGDWLAMKDGNAIFLVEEIGRTSYLSIKEQGYGIFFDEEYKWRKWTIADINAGELYVTKKDEVVLVKEITKKGSVFGYGIANEAVALMKFDNIKCPATKEQKEAFFHTLYRKGYRWDSFNREFKELPFAVGDVVRSLKGDGKIYNITDIDKNGYTDDDIFICPLGNENHYVKINVNPIFKVGDVIVPKCYNEEHKIVKLTNYRYILDCGMNIPFKDQDLWESVEERTLRKDIGKIYEDEIKDVLESAEEQFGEKMLTYIRESKAKSYASGVSDVIEWLKKHYADVIEKGADVDVLCALAKKHFGV